MERAVRARKAEATPQRVERGMMIVEALVTLEREERAEATLEREERAEATLEKVERAVVTLQRVGRDLKVEATLRREESVVAPRVRKQMLHQTRRVFR